jgi:uncharacterized delta-60 repeat protein
VSGLTSGNLAIARYNPDLTIDSSFGGVGYVNPIAVPNPSAMILQPDGKIVATASGPFGSLDYMLVRYNADGTPDNTFDNDGTASVNFGGTDNAYALAIQPDGKLVVTGRVGPSAPPYVYDFGVARFNTDGSIDNSFGSAGKVVTPVSVETDLAEAVAVRSDGKIVAAGHAGNTPNRAFAVVVYNVDGSLDHTFGGDGIVVTPIGPSDAEIRDVAWQPDGNIVVAGYASGTGLDFAVARYLVSFDLGVLQLSTLQGLVTIYPNPIKECSTLRYTLSSPETLTVDLIDVQGRFVFRIMNEQGQEAGEHLLDLTLPKGLSSGQYFLVISSPNGQQAVQVMVTD